MRSNRSASAFLLPFVLVFSGAPLCAQDPAPAVVEKTGQFFVLHCHGGDETFAQQALDAIEPVWPFVATAFGKPDAKPKQPLHVHLYRTIAGYEAADQQLTNGKFQRNLAMTHWDTGSAHVALQPPCTDETLRAIGLPGLTIELLAWEACHTARLELCPNFRDHPMWLIDGLGSSVGRQALERARPAGGAGLSPTASTDLVLVQRLQQQKKMPPASAILADRIDDLAFHDRYAARAVFFQFLSTPPFADRLPKVFAAVRTTGGGGQYTTQVLALARKTLGSTLDKDFTQYVHKQRPKWFEVFRSLILAGTTSQQLAFPDKNAIAWCQEPVRGASIAITGKLRILPGGRQQLNVLIAQGPDGGFYSVAFVADSGFTVFDYQGKQDRWQELGKGNAPGLRLGYESTFSVEAANKKLRIRLDDQHWDFELPRALPNEVLWGLGAQAGGDGAPCGSAGLWTDVTAASARN